MIKHCLIVVNIVLSNTIQNMCILGLKLSVSKAGVKLTSSVTTAECSDGIVAVNTTTIINDHGLTNALALIRSSSMRK